MTIIGVSAKKQGGKTSVVDILKKRCRNPRVIRFADKLKEIVIACFVPSEWHWTVDDLDVDEKKNTMLPCGKTTRQMLQVVGSDQFRHTWEGCWINTYGAALSWVVSNPEAYPVILTPDVRFPNELRYIQQRGGRVIRLMRAPFGAQDTHESETALDPAMWATLLQWDKYNSEELLDGQEARKMDLAGLISQLNIKLPDLYAKWTQNPVLFDQIRDNRNVTMDEQRQWVNSWLNPNFE